ncbi:MAG: hypothetical protein A3C02_00945 [Candidatus Andersenbacteria bacterium RIFCSPHIGHO2_02_FULL_45_11]|uniref:Methyltransferase FkbM domain-containing protein n=1 Tax=Candidatus Andersenbacteria bacterium RIFCSPHIGHO2_12_FULL_45_11 TaxID=1797281 RepID=A0A1G1WZC4_9BACT|nr:MAG: hypothetical protein A2805_00560 [Candidatus Andersenbacteria bacterium RIFCSPHIGHO2_01_FULL_46_36]OGY33118.1 MAG: hypothetical protein A3D99_01515 [Candidatus Andersenbacteria bacterium RIFCSPHIGHO2_12_FULL_45_11]OGY33143.1 MAG: hypothetical protein A3C02_00945 [Candidatus Andersenbacteria bacterium RIFCSPHIGHO2_02_FULL_45_11]
MAQPKEHTEYIYNSVVKLALRSFALDWAWVHTPAIPKKYVFLIKKYLFLIAYPLFWDTQTHSYRIHLWNRDVHLENREHIGIIQSTFVNNAYLKQTVPPHGTIIDIGAHTGEFALFSDVYLEAGRIYSFEPVGRSYELLTHNKKDHTYHLAIGTKENIIMYIPQQTAMASAVPTGQDHHHETVACARLDEHPEIDTTSHIDLLKIDVEGMEYDVLMASIKTLQKTQTLLVEISIDRPATKPPMETVASIHAIVPTFELSHIGQIFGDFTWTDSVDFLFERQEY